MRKISKILFLVMMVLMLTPTIALCDDPYDLEKETRDFAYFTLRKILIHSLDKELSGADEEAVVSPDGLIVLLADMDSDEARGILLELVEVYVGSATGEAVTYAVVKQGKSIRDDLKSLRSKPVTCSLLANIKNHPVLKCLSRQERDSRISRYIGFINSGEIIQYVP